MILTAGSASASNWSVPALPLPLAPSNCPGEGERAARLRSDLPYFAEHCLKLRPKTGSLEPFIFNPAQLELRSKNKRPRPDGCALSFSKRDSLASRVTLVRGSFTAAYSSRG